MTEGIDAVSTVKPPKRKKRRRLKPGLWFGPRKVEVEVVKKAHKPFAVYTERRALLQAMTEIVEPGTEPFYPLISTECADQATLQTMCDEARADAIEGRVKGLVAKYPNPAYPHGAKSDAWVWAYRKEG